MAARSFLLALLRRLLPREFRERVVEPAWADLALEEHASPPRRAAALAARAILVLECLRLALPAIIWNRGRLTRLSRAALVVMLLIVAALLIARRRAYAAHGPW